MKRICTAILLSILSVLTYSETLFFRSNVLGMKLQRVGDFRRDEFPYIMKTDSAPDGNTDTLFHFGEEIKRWEVSGRIGKNYKESFYTDGLLQKVSIIENGRLMEDISYSAGVRDTRSIYNYRNHLVQSVAVYREEELLYEDFYERASGGRLRRVRRIYPDQTEIISAYSFADGELIEESHISGDNTELFRFEGNKILSEERWEGAELVKSEVFSYKEGNSSLITDHRTGELESREYNDKGFLIREVKNVDGVMEIDEYQYQADNLVLKINKSGGLRKEWRYLYNDQDSLVREEFYKNGGIVTITVYTGEDEYFEEIYSSKGRLFLKVYYKEDQKISEEFIRTAE